MLSTKDIASQVNKIDVAAFSAHRQSVGHKPRETCDQCPQPITNLIVKFAKDNYDIKPRKNKKRGVFN